MTSHPDGAAGLDDRLLTPAQLAEYLQVSTAALANDRYLGKGPRFIKLGGKVRYRESDVTAYLDANRYTRTDTKETNDDQSD